MLEVEESVLEIEKGYSMCGRLGEGRASFDLPQNQAAGDEPRGLVKSKVDEWESTITVLAKKKKRVGYIPALTNTPNFVFFSISRASWLTTTSLLLDRFC